MFDQLTLRLPGPTDCRIGCKARASPWQLVISGPVVLSTSPPPHIQRTIKAVAHGCGQEPTCVEGNTVFASWLDAEGVNRAAQRGTPGWRRLKMPAVMMIAAVAVTLITACGQRNDFSATERALPHAVNVDAGPLALRNLRVDLIESPPFDSVRAALRGAFINTGSGHDELLRVTSPAASSVRLSPAGDAHFAPVPLPVGAAQSLQHQTERAWLLLGELREPLRAGGSIPVTFHFAQQGKVTVTVPVTGA